MKEKSGNRSVWISAVCFCRPSLQPSSSDSVTWKADVYEPCHYLPSGGIQPEGNSYRREEGSLGWSCASGIPPRLVPFRALPQSPPPGKGKGFNLSKPICFLPGSEEIIEDWNQVR